ncbi:hypothetical protein E4U60_002168 [Claviceps pazoutovae]|uniref:Uncharacterized protein n=1 Tax=Claviceps pazoutovae TaxID=1649127 RepID=A0A9P7SHD4_9HYPO|nr:hypothetical protein E4U60_002168 [Claviceps pazoutovae]
MAPKYYWLPKDEEEPEQPLQEEYIGDCSRPSAERPKQGHSHNAPTRWKPSLSTCKDVFLLFFAILGFVSLLRPHSQALWTPGSSAMKTIPTSCSCGNSTAQALAIGCKYDSLAAAWLPPHCRDDDLTAEFDRSGPGKDGQWTYWRDLARTQEISLDELATMGDDKAFRFYMTGQWHVVHCIFYWRKEHRARFNGKMVEPRSDTEGHIKHCGKVLMDPEHDTIAGVELNTDR